MDSARAKATAPARRPGKTSKKAPPELAPGGLTAEELAVVTKLEPPATYLAKAAAIKASMDEATNALAAEWKTLEMEVGLAVLAKKVKPRDLVNQWDKKLKGSLSKVEFRLGVTRNLGIQAKTKEIE